MTKKLSRIWIAPDVKKRIKVGAAAEGLTLSDFVRKKIDDRPRDILDDFDQGRRKKKKGRGFDFPL